MGKKNPFKILPLDVESFLLSTAHMSNEAVGAYARILFKGWIDLWPVGTFPKENEVLSELAQSSTDEWQRIRPAVIRRFRGPNAAGKLLQERLQRTFREVREKVSQASENGRKAGLASAKARENKRQRPPDDSSTGVDPPSTIEPNQTELNGIELNQTKPNARARGRDGVKAVLAWAGVGGGIKRCLTVDGLTALGVLIAAEKNKGGGGGPGQLVEKITNGYTPLRIIHPETLAALCRRARVAAICGHEVHSDGTGSNVAYSNHEIVIATATGDVRIPERRLLAEQIEVRLDAEI